jgi:hypothetical protein
VKQKPKIEVVYVREPSTDYGEDVKVLLDGREIAYVEVSEFASLLRAVLNALKVTDVDITTAGEP